MRKIILIASILFITINFSGFSQSKIYRTLFTSRSAEIDTSIDKKKKINEDKIPRVVRLDLNMDGTADIFKTTYEKCSSSGCLWEIFDGKTNKKIGDIKGSIIYILKNKSEKFFDIEAYWKLSGKKAGTAYFYSYSKGKYRETKTSDISNIKNYFANKPQFTKELEILK